MGATNAIQSGSHRTVAANRSGISKQRNDPEPILQTETNQNLSTGSLAEASPQAVDCRTIRGKTMIPLQIQNDRPSDHPSGIELRIGRVVIAVTPGFDRDLLAEIIRAVGAAC